MEHTQSYILPLFMPVPWAPLLWNAPISLWNVPVSVSPWAPLLWNVPVSVSPELLCPQTTLIGRNDSEPPITPIVSGPIARVLP